MGLDLWFREDVTRILASAYETMQASTEAVDPQYPEVAAIYRQGFVDALRTMAVAFGVSAPSFAEMEPEARRAIPSSRSARRLGQGD